MDYRTELKGIIKELLDDKTNTKNEEIIDTNEEKMAKLLEDNADMKEKMEKLLTTSTEKTVIVPEMDATTTLYKGYDLLAQGETLTIKDESKKERIAKFLIDTVTKTMNEGTTTAGGHLVPEEYQVELLGFARETSVALQDCRVMPMSRDVMKFPRENGGVSVNWAATETTANVLTEPTVSMVTLSTERMGAYVPVTNDLLEDSAFDIVSFLTGLFAEAVGQELDNQVFNGTPFASVLDGAGSTITISGTTFASVDHEDFSLAIAELSDIKLSGAKFYMNKAIKHYIRILKDGSDRLIYTLPSGIIPANIYEIPVRTVEKMVGTTAAATSFILLGNLKNYILGKRRGMTIKANPYILMKENTTQFVVSSRWDGQIGLAGGFVDIATHA